MNTKKFISGTLLLSFVLLASVFIVPVISWMRHLLFDYVIPDSSGTMKENIGGIVGETVRAVVTMYLYPRIEGAGSSMKHGIKYGLILSALIGSLWIFVGATGFVLKNPWSFAINDSIILIVQGIVSGIVLYYLFRVNNSKEQ